MGGRLLKVLVAVIGMACFAWGQDEEPGRGVARISLMNGEVSVRRGDSGEWVAAALNAPLMAEDRVLTAAGARVEVQFDGANMARLASMTEVRLGQLENGHFQLQLARGLVTFRVLRKSPAQVEISTPSVAVHPMAQGVYRIEVREDGSVEITVRSGEAEVATPQGSERLPAGKTMMVRGDPADPEFQVAQAIGIDDWDKWNQRRDQELERSRSYNYVSPDVYGAEDLDASGSWVDTPPYGPCWYPRVEEGWAPYRHGRWSWMDYYGWSWISYDPWGWAPYHYGRWFYGSNHGWAWWPGARYGHHYWSPGLVAFVGWNSWGGAHVGIGFGGIGWIPLAPFERYHPWYGRGYYSGYRNGYFGGGLNVVGDVNIGHLYRNARFRDGVTAVDTHGFISGRAGGPLRGGSELTRGSLVRGVLPVTPGRESLRMSDRPVRMTNLPRGGSDGRFFSRMQTARTDRVSFDQQRRGLEQMTRRTFGGTATGVGQGLNSGARSVAPQSGWRQAGGNAASGSATGGSNNWRRFGEPGSGTGWRSAQTNRASVPGGGVSRSGGEGWNRFGTGSANSGRSVASPGTITRTVDRGQYYGGASQPVRISPPIVRERAPSSGGSNYSRPAQSSGGGGAHSGGGSHGGGGRSR